MRRADTVLTPVLTPYLIFLVRGAGTRADGADTLRRDAYVRARGRTHTRRGGLRYMAYRRGVSAPSARGKFGFRDPVESYMTIGGSTGCQPVSALSARFGRLNEIPAA